MSISDHRDIVAALREVPGVAEADVEPDGEGEGLGLLRLGLAPGVDEVEVASAVGRLLRERFGLGVDADRVQLVEDMQAEFDDPDIEDDEDDESDRFRPAIRRMHIISSGLQVAAEVTLSVGERTALGRAEGTATQSGVQRAVATATLRAVEDLLDGKARFELDLVELTSTGRERAVLVAVTMLSAGGSEKLTGAAAVREDVRQAAIRATLDALNRRVEHMVS
ncbi:MAG: hypothetical protein ACRDV3_02280 [Acidothermaceae bacterium]